MHQICWERSSQLHGITQLSGQPDIIVGRIKDHRHARRVDGLHDFIVFYGYNRVCVELGQFTLVVTPNDLPHRRSAVRGKAALLRETAELPLSAINGPDSLLTQESNIGS